MLKEILSAIEEHLADVLNPEGATRQIYVARYKNEFEDGADWNPKFPCVLYRLKSVKLLLRNMSGEITNYEMRMILYCADRDINSPAGLDIIDQVIEATDNVHIEYNIQSSVDYAEIEVSDAGIELHGYTTQVEVYRMDIVINV